MERQRREIRDEIAREREAQRREREELNRIRAAQETAVPQTENPDSTPEASAGRIVSNSRVMSNVPASNVSGSNISINTESNNTPAVPLADETGASNSTDAPNAPSPGFQPPGGVALEPENPVKNDPPEKLERKPDEKSINDLKREFEEPVDDVTPEEMKQTQPIRYKRYLIYVDAQNRPVKIEPILDNSALDEPEAEVKEPESEPEPVSPGQPEPPKPEPEPKPARKPKSKPIPDQIFPQDEAGRCWAEFAPDGKTFVTAGMDHQVKVRDGQTGAYLKTLTGHEKYVGVARYSKNGKYILSGGWAGTIRVWDAATGKQKRKYIDRSPFVCHIALSPDNKSFVSCGGYRECATVRVWDLQTGRVKKILSGFGACVWMAEYSPDGKRLATACEDGFIRVFDTQTWFITGQIAIDACQYSVTWSPTGKTIISGGIDKNVNVWNTVSDKVFKLDPASDDQILHARFSPNGEYISAVGGKVDSDARDFTVRVWSVKTQELFASFTGHEKPVCSGNWSPTSRRLLTVSADRTARIWGINPETKDEVPAHAEGAGKRLVKTIKGVEFAFRWCPPGEFMMGDGDAHKVTISKGFWMMETEVTQAQWKAMMGDNPSEFIGDTLPVEKVSWNDCQEFCKKVKSLGLPLALPTEAQWEYACRAGSTGPYADDLDAMAWYSSNSGSKTHPVGTKTANAWGLYDMHGNVWEWCNDAYRSDISSNATDSVVEGGDGSARVDRGGWSNSDRYCRSALRSGDAPDYQYSFLGLRCCLVQ